MPFTAKKRTPIIDTVNEYIESHDLSRREFSKQIARYIDHKAGSDAFYQRQYKLLNGDYKELREDEQEAYQMWLSVEKAGKHTIGVAIYRMLALNPAKKVKKARKWLSSGIFNPTKARRLTKKLENALKEIEELF